MAEFKSVYGKLSVYVGEHKAQFINGYYSTDNEEVAAYLRTQVGYIEEIIKEKAEEVSKPAPAKAPAKTRSKATAKKTSSEE